MYGMPGVCVNRYHRQPKVPVQEYPEVTRPMARIRIDLTGELPVTDGNGSKYILVVKDSHHICMVILLKSKDAVAMADQLVTVRYSRDGGIG